MTSTATMNMHAYNPNRLLDGLLQRLGLHSDNALSRKLKVTRRVLANIRCGRLPIGASLLLWIQDATGIAVAELRNMLGDRRAKLRLCYPLGKR